MKTRHRRAGSFAIPPGCGSQQGDDLSVPPWWQASNSRCRDRPPWNTLSRFIENWCSREPLRAINIAIPVARSVTVATRGKSLHDVLSARDYSCFLSRFRSGLRLLLLGLLRKCDLCPACCEHKESST